MEPDDDDDDILERRRAPYGARVTATAPLAGVGGVDCALGVVVAGTSLSCRGVVTTAVQPGDALPATMTGS